MFCIRVAWVCLLLCKEECSSPVSAITEGRDMDLYEVLLSMSLLGIGMRTMLANFHMYGIMLVLRAASNMPARNTSLRGPMCFRLSGPCELLFLLCFITSWTRVLGECDAISVHPMCCSVNASLARVLRV